MAALRNLGDDCLKVDGDTMTGQSIAGTLALQDDDDVAITGGTITGVAGIVPLGVILPFYGNSTDAEALLATAGLAVCDGRTITLSNGTQKLMPDLRGLYQQFGTGNATQTGGQSTYTIATSSFTQTFTATVPSSGGHTGWSGSTLLLGNSALGFVNPVVQDFSVLAQSVAVTVPAQSLSLTVAPPFVALWPMMRVQ